jgi:hypothetical protein
LPWSDGSADAGHDADGKHCSGLDASFSLIAAAKFSSFGADLFEQPASDAKAMVAMRRTGREIFI